MKPLYELPNTITLAPQVYKMDRDDEMTPFIQGTGISIYPAPGNNAVGTNDLAGAITIISFHAGKMKLDRYFEKKIDAYAYNSDNNIPSGMIPSTIGQVNGSSFSMYDLKTQKHKKRIIKSGRSSILKSVLVDATKKHFIFHLEENTSSSKSQEAESKYTLNLMDLSGEKAKLIKKTDIGAGVRWTVANDRIIMWQRSDKYLQVLDLNLEPADHPLADIIKRNNMEYSEIYPHPTLPFAIIRDREGAMSVSWGKGRKDEPALLMRRVTDFRFSPDGKWLVFTYGWFTDEIRKTYLMPVSDKLPYFLGRPILLHDDDFVPGKYCWTKNPITFVGSQKGGLFRWELTNELHPESDKSTFHEYMVEKNLKSLPVKVEIPSYKSILSEKPVDLLDAFSPVRESTFRISPDSRRVAYVSEGRFGVAAIVDGKVGNHYDDIRELAFSSDGKRVAYIADINEKSMAVIDGEEGQEFEGVASLAFSPDGRHVAYAVNQNNKWFLVADGKKQKEGYDGLAAITFSPDSKRIAYGALQNGKWSVVTDGKSGKSYEGVGGLMFSRDGSRFAYLARLEGKTFIVLDDKEQNKCEAIGGAAFSPDSRRFAYVTVANGKWSVVADGKKGKSYNSIAALAFSPDSRRMSYVAQSNDKWFAVVDDEEQRKYDGLNIGGVIFSPDSKRVAYGALLKNRWFAVIDGQEQSRNYDNIGTIMFSPDSKRVAYVVMSNLKALAVVDGREGYPYEALWSVAISPGGKHVAYVVKEDKKVFAVVDGKEGKKYDDILTVAGGRLLFDSDDGFHYIAVTNRQLNSGDDETVIMGGDTLCLVEEKIKDDEQ